MDRSPSTQVITAQGRHGNRYMNGGLSTRLNDVRPSVDSFKILIMSNQRFLILFYSLALLGNGGGVDLTFLARSLMLMVRDLMMCSVFIWGVLRKNSVVSRVCKGPGGVVPADCALRMAMTGTGTVEVSMGITASQQ